MPDGLTQAVEAMRAAGLGPTAVDAFDRQYRELVSGVDGMIPEADIDPHEMRSLGDAQVPQQVATRALAGTAIIKLNGGLGTSMGLDRAKSLLRVRGELTFLDIIARQVLAARRRYDVRLPITFLHSFRTSADCLQALSKFPDLATDGVPAEILQNRVPKLRADDLTPVRWPDDPALEWCPPGHGDLYTVLHQTGLLDTLLDAGFTQAFVSNSDNLGAVADPRVAGWFAHSGAPFAVEAVRRTASDRKGGHFAVRRRDGRIILRETAQTRPQDQAALADLDRHRFASTNNIWFDLKAMRTVLRASGGFLHLPLIKNVKTVDPTDPESPAVIQLETAMGAAIELFDHAQTIEVGRDRFVPVKSTDDLLVVRSDCYRVDEESALHQNCAQLPVVALGPAYRLVEGFEERFPHGPPSLVEASSLAVSGDWTFGEDVHVVGAVTLGPGHGTVPSGTVLRADSS